jgi:hypothetical protein
LIRRTLARNPDILLERFAATHLDTLEAYHLFSPFARSEIWISSQLAQIVAIRIHHTSFAVYPQQMMNWYIEWSLLLDNLT